MGEWGTWEQRTPDWWVYRLAGQELPFAHVLCQREEGASGPVWDALPADGVQPWADGVSLEEAQAAVEREAGQRPWQPGQGDQGPAGDGHRRRRKGP